VAFCAVWYFETSILAPLHWLPITRDFVHYQHAGQAILNGTSPYANVAWFYPPLTAFLMVPFALTDYVTARWIWFLLSQAFLMIAAWLLWRALGRDRIALCSLAIVWAFGGAGEESLEGGQIGPLLVLLLAAAYTEHSARQGAALGIGFVLKYIPGVAAIALILNRSWRALVVFASVAAAGVLLPLAVLMLFFPGPYGPLKPRYWMGTPHTHSWSIPSVTLRILDPPQGDGRLPHNWHHGNAVENLNLSPREELLSAGTAAAVLTAGILALVFACGGKLNREQVPLAMAGLISLSLAAAPVCWTHYQILQYPGVALLLADSIRRRTRLIATCVALSFVMMYPVPHEVFTYYERHGGLATASPAALYVWTSMAPAACLALYGLAVRRLQTDATGRAQS
jgi:hypothetical protein